MLRRWFVCALATAAALGVPSPVPADVTAEYIGENERERTIIEVADNGALRVTQGTGDGYVLIVDGKAYSVEPGPGGPLVTASDVIAHSTRRELEAGDLVIHTLEGEEQPAFFRFVLGEAIELAGYRGTEYGPERGNRTPIGIADDPALAPLGQAYLRYERAVDEMSADAEVVPDNLEELLAERGVIRFWGRNLQRVSFDPIDPARFALPAEPLTLAQVLQAEADQPPSRDKGETDFQSPVERALFFNNALYTLTTQGKLERWTDGAPEGAVVDTPDAVAAMCVMGGQLLIVTGSRGQDTVRLWSGANGSWQEETRFEQSRENPFLTLDCSGGEPLLLTAKALRLPRSERTIAIDPEKLAPGGYFTTLQHGNFLYVGSNAGEWGGGLRRFSLADGSGQAIDSADPEELCGGTLNMSCDPVTGITVDPANPACILASVGLVHFAPHGQVVRVCDGRVTLAYRKPYTLDPNWEANPPAEESFSSVPFFSMVSSEGASWAVGNDGLYRFDSQERPAFEPFGRAKRWPASRLDWSDPRFVLVLTSMNQVHSISGGSLLLVPR